ncbi:MAG: polysaccharide biosynthesis/export family protein [Bacteroidales bacterium]|nr:polysaccharide biosynthesis/export family protein [Bacteroidales bacterium]
MKSMIKIYLVSIIGLFSVVSCVPLKESIYLQGDMAIKLEDLEGQYKIEKGDYLVKPSDLLYIRVTSLDDRSSAFLNNESGYNAMANNPMSASLLGYRVGLDGAIDYPFLGKIYVAGLSLQEVAQKIELAASKYIDQSGAIVKLLNDHVTVMGEVQAPGRFLMNSEEISILEAVSLSGDMTDFANRKTVRLIRKDGETPQMIIIDTTDEKLLFSPYFYLKPGDIIYVEPRRLKQWNLSAVPLGLATSLVSVSILVYSLTMK